MLGSPGRPGDPIERWHDDAIEGARQLGWDVKVLTAREVTSDQVIAASRGADMLLWMRTSDAWLADNAGWKMLRGVEDLGVRTAGVHFDLYWGVARRQLRIGENPWWSAQHIFTSDGGDHPWGDRGVNHHWCPSPFGTRYLGYGRAGVYRYRGVFVGSIYPVHGWTRRQLVQWAKGRWGRQFRHVGHSTKMYGKHLNNLFASADMVLGHSAPSPRYWSDRVVRTLGRGGLLSYPLTEGMAEQGFDDRVMITYSGGHLEHMCERFDSMTVAGRRAMTDAGIALVEERHLWRHRLAEMQGVVFS